MSSLPLANGSLAGMFLDIGDDISLVDAHITGCQVFVVDETVLFLALLNGLLKGFKARLFPFAPGGFPCNPL